MSYLSDLLNSLSGQGYTPEDVARHQNVYDQLASGYYTGGQDNLMDGYTPPQYAPEIPQASYSNEGRALNALMQQNLAYQNPPKQQIPQQTAPTDELGPITDATPLPMPRRLSMREDNTAPGVSYGSDLPQNFVINNTTGKVTNLDYAAAPRQKDVWADGAQVLSRQKLSDGRTLVTERVPAMDGFGRQSTSVQQRIEGNTLAEQKTMAEIAKLQAEAGKATAEAKSKGVPTEEKPMTAAQRVKFEKDFAHDYGTVQQTQETMGQIMQAIQGIRGSKGLDWREGYSGYFPAPLQGKEAMSAQNRIDTLKGKVTQMGKAMASMAGAIGPMAVQEWKIVADAVNAIDPTAGNFQEQLANIENQAEGAITRIRDKYERQYLDRFDRYQQFRLPERSAPPPKDTAAAIPESAKQYLRNNPTLRGEFEKKYGAGSAASVLGG